MLVTEGRVEGEGCTRRPSVNIETRNDKERSEWRTAANKSPDRLCTLSMMVLRNPTCRRESVCIVLTFHCQ